MDLNSLITPELPLTTPAAVKWLKLFQKESPAQGFGRERWENILETNKPYGLSVDDELVGKMINWIEMNSLWEGAGEDKTLSMRGVGVVLSSGQPRKSPDQAWSVAGDLVGAARWVNESSVENAPMKVADILLFGSMTDPETKDHGDLDAIVLFESKQGGAYDIAEKHLSGLGLGEVLRPKDSGLPSFRVALRQWLAEMMPFTSLDDQMRTVTVLLDQDPGFGCYSMLGKSWTLEDLSRTTADEDAFLIMEALERGQRDRRKSEYVSGRIYEMDLVDLAVKMGELVKPIEVMNPLRSHWWKNLNRPDLGFRRSTIKSLNTVDEPRKIKRTPNV